MSQSNYRLIIYCIISLILSCTLQREEEQKKEKGKVSQIFRIGNGSEPQDLDPGIITGNVESRIVENLFEGLTVPDLHTGKPSRGVAKTWESNEDATIFRSEERR